MGHYTWSVCLVFCRSVAQYIGYFVAQTSTTVFKITLLNSTHVTTMDCRFARDTFKNIGAGIAELWALELTGF